MNRVTVHEDVFYRSTPERDLRLDLLAPESDDGSPAFVFAHGGAYFEGDKGGADRPFLRELAANGVVCLDVQYRLSDEAAFPAPASDVASVVRWARDAAGRYGIDPDAVWVGGVSAGAHLGAYLSTLHQWRYEEAGDRHPVGSIRIAGVIGISGLYDLLTYCENAGERTRFEGVPTLAELSDDSTREVNPFEAAWGGSVNELPDVYSEASPAIHVSADVPPTILLHGADDMLIPHRQATRYRDRLREHGVRVELFLAEEGPHTFYRKKPWMDRTVRKITSFVATNSC